MACEQRKRRRRSSCLGGVVWWGFGDLHRSAPGFEFGEVTGVIVVGFDIGKECVFAKSVKE
jgi:hypothetical protein